MHVLAKRAIKIDMLKKSDKAQLCRSSSAYLVEFFVMDHAGLRREQAEEACIDREDIDCGGGSFAQIGLDAVVVNAELISKREHILLDHARRAIEHQYIVAGCAGVLLQAERAVKERANQDLRVLIPTLHSHLVGDVQ